MKNSKLYSFTKTTSRVLEIILVASAVLSIVGEIIVFFALNDVMLENIKGQITNGNITINDFGMSLEDFGNVRVLSVFGCLYGFICTALGSLIFRNIHKVFKNVERDKTPFTKENISLIKNIGIYSIVTPFVGTVIGFITALISKDVHINSSLDVTTILVIFAVLCLSQFFAYSVKLEEEVEGLV